MAGQGSAKRRAAEGLALAKLERSRWAACGIRCAATGSYCAGSNRVKPGTISLSPDPARSPQVHVSTGVGELLTCSIFVGERTCIL